MGGAILAGGIVVHDRTEIRTEEIIRRGLELAATEGVAPAWVYLVANEVHRHTIMHILAEHGYCDCASAEEPALS